MPLFVNTNAMSLQAQRSVAVSAAGLQTSLQRLSSGQRINSAKDDAAGLGISTRLSTQVNGLNQAARNAQDALSLTQVAEAALGEVTTTLQRIRELAVQSINASNSAADRKVLDAEVQQRLAEIDRIASQTRFNGQRLLDGSFGTAQFQVGANAGETVSLNLSQGAGASSLGKLADYVSSTVGYDDTVPLGRQGSGVTGSTWTAGGLSLQVGSAAAVAIADPVAGTAAGQTASSAWAKAAAVNASGVSGLEAFASTDVTMNWAQISDQNYTMTINGVQVYNSNSFYPSPLTGAQAAGLINTKTASTGVTASWDAAAGALRLVSAEGRDIAISQFAGLNNTTQASNGSNAANNAVNSAIVQGGPYPNMVYGPLTYRGTVRLRAAEAVMVSGSGAAALGYVSGSTLGLAVGSIATATVRTADAANTVLLRTDAALAAVSTLRGTLGAMGTRVEATINSILVNAENLQAARSRVLDTDYAAETANLTRSQVMQQAATAILSQANAAPQSALALLK